MTLTITIYERRTRVLDHVFYGRSKRYVIGLVTAHQQTDTFFRAATATSIKSGPWTFGSFHGIPLSAEWTWGQ